MKTKEFDTFGSYDTSFLHLKVYTKENIFNLTKLFKDKNKIALASTFLHEYIHFLQNVTTSYGLMSGIVYVDLIKDINYSIINDGKPEFEVPIIFDNKNNVKANKELQEIYSGDSKPVKYIKYDRYEVEEKPVEYKDGNSMQVKRYKVHYFNKASKPESFYFGATCIKEYMAHAIQSKFLPTTEHTDVPYTVAELIVEKEYPLLARDKMFIVALCDACLMHLHPAQLFFDSLERMSAQRFMPVAVGQIYDFCFHEMQFNGPMGSLTRDQVFEKMTGVIDEQYDDALKSPIFRPNYKWLNHVFQEGKKLRLKNPTFMTQLVAGENELSTLFYEIVRNFGTPFFSNNTGKGGFIPPTDLKGIAIQPHQLLVFKEVIRIFDGDKHCILYPFCKSDPANDITNSLCRTAPWQRVHEAELCPLAQIWRTWGLTGEVPVPR